MTKKDYQTISKVIYRAHSLSLAYADQLSMVMDIEYSGIDFDKLLAFDDLNFTHDIAGIRAHFNRETMTFENCFAPRAGLRS